MTFDISVGTADLVRTSACLSLDYCNYGNLDDIVILVFTWISICELSLLPAILLFFTRNRVCSYR